MSLLEEYGDPRSYGCSCDECPLQKRKHVPPELRPNARFLIVGQDPGSQELKERRPFVGPSGELLKHILGIFGLERDDVGITNCRLCNAPRSWTANDVRQGKAYACCFPRLEVEAKAAKALLILGARAVGLLYPPARSSKGKGLLTKVRGFPLTIYDKPAMATFHPAAALPKREPGLQKIIRNDLGRLLRMLSGSLRWVEPGFCFDPTLGELDSFLDRCDRRLVAVDIETTRAIGDDRKDAALDTSRALIRCVGLGTTEEGIVLGFRSVESPQRRFRLDPAIATERLANFFERAPLEHSVVFGGHNVNVYDRPVMKRHKFPLPDHRFVRDSMAAHHVVCSEEPHTLDYVISTSRIDAPKHKPLTSHAHEHWDDDWEYHRYNLLDVVTNARVLPDLLRQVVATNQRTAYEVNIQLQRLCEGMRRAGLYVDLSERNRHKVRLEAAKVQAQARADEILGRHLALGSHAQVRRFLYDTCGLEPNVQFQTTTGEASTNRDAIYDLITNQTLPPRVTAFLDALLSYRLADKYKDFTEDAEPAADGRVHPDWNIGPNTGRLRSKNPNCFDGATEVLTPGGWVQFDKYRPGTPVMQWQARSKPRFVEPTGYVKQPAPGGSMVLLTGPNVDLCVTHDHRCLVFSSPWDPHVFSADEYPVGREGWHQLHLSFSFGGAVKETFSPTEIVRRVVVPYTIRPVYCVSVPSSYIVVRRNGKVCVTGQCQNIPSTRADLDSLRSMYIAAPGNVLVYADMEQIELRLVTAVAQDQIWFEAFRKGIDVHKLNASDVLGFPIEQVQKFHRTFVKTFVYRLFYRGGYAKACRQMQQLRDPGSGKRPYANFKLSEAEAMQGRLLRLHPLEKWWDATTAEWEKKHELRSILHNRRRVFINGLYSSAEEVLGELVNFRIQATAADAVNNACIELMETVPWGLYGPGIIHQGHDSIMIEVEARYAERTKKAMEHAMKCEVLGMPLLAKAKSGTRWSALD